MNAPAGQQQDGNASLYVQQAGEVVVWQNLEYATATGNTIAFQYVVCHANSTRAIGPSQQALRGFYEFSINSRGGNAALGLALALAGHDEAVQVLYGTISYQDQDQVRLADDANHLYATTGT